VGDWNIVTLVTLSSRVSSSRMSRGIHHKCKHPLNPTRLYVSRWVESSLSVLIWKVITCLDDVCILDCESIYDCMIKSFGSSLPFACLIALCVVLLPLRWSSIIAGSICERYSWSTGERWFRYIVYLGWTSCSFWAFL